MNMKLKKGPKYLILQVDINFNGLRLIKTNYFQSKLIIKPFIELK
jgi:hypothetical protein